jgi:hypothetical protein
VGLLDENGYPFADPRGRKLHDDLAELYNPRSAELLSRQAALPIARIDFQGSARDVWQNVLDVAAKCGKLRGLAQVIVEDPMSVKARPLLQSLLQEAPEPVPTGQSAPGPSPERPARAAAPSPRSLVEPLTGQSEEIKPVLGTAPSLPARGADPGGGEAINGPGPGTRPGAIHPRRAARTIWRPGLIIASITSAVVVVVVIANNLMPGTPISNPPAIPTTSLPATPTTGPSTASSRGNYSDCAADNCYSIAISPSSMSGSPYQGARATMYLTRMRSGSASPSNPAYINSSLQVILNSAHNSFLEEGIYDGWVGADGTQICARINSHSHCVHFIYEPGNGGPSPCINNGCTAYIIYWADTSMSGTSENTYFHIVNFTYPSPGTQLYVDDGYNQGEWKVHIKSKGLGLEYYGESSLNSRYRYVESIKVGGQLDQVAKSGACADTELMTFGMWIPPGNYESFDAQAPTTAHIDTSTFNGTQQVPGINQGTWQWSIPTISNYNGC